MALALEGTTTTALMGGPADNEGVGAVWVFTRAGTGGTWGAQGEKLKGAGETGEGQFGASVALSLLSTTMTALVGGPGDERSRCGVGVHARGHCLEPAGREAHRRR